MDGTAINAHIAQLEAELEALRSAQRAATKPVQLNVMNLAPLSAICQNYIDDLENCAADADYTEYIFEVAMTTVFGDNVFAWINEQGRSL